MGKFKETGSKVFIPVLLTLVLLVSVISGCAAPAPEMAPPAPTEPTVPMAPTEPSTPILNAPSSPAPSTAPTAPSESFKADGTIGLAVGGAMDVNNFRENIENGYLPLPTDITYEGLFYDYYFDTGQTETCNKLFCPSHSCAVTRDPFSGKTEYYLSVGLNSGMRESDFERKKLNLVVVLDISGSMKESFDRYYYDNPSNGGGYPDSKIEVAKEAVLGLLDHLDDDDRFGMVLFNNSARLVKPMNLVGETDMDAIEDHIRNIRASGGTNLDAGMDLATDQYNGYLYADQSDYENRIILLTDAMPNIGDTSERSLLGKFKSNAGHHLYTTFIGVGVDFNTELVEYISKTRGANYYSVHSPEEFVERMDDEFEYMVTPLVFDLRLVLEADGWEIEQVYGSPEADQATGELMKVNTLFPSERKGGQTKGGLILLKLRRAGSGNRLELKTYYEDRNGNTDGGRVTISFDKESPEYFANSGIRKGVLLTRYVDLLQNWMIDERSHIHYSQPWEPTVDREVGIVPPPSYSQWERQSLPLVVSYPYRELLEEFADYFEYEMNEIHDSTLEQEIEILENLSGDGEDWDDGDNDDGWFDWDNWFDSDKEDDWID